ncbi:cell division protein FtsA [Pelagibacterales bacterium SAG-MED20]|nr:cell division protein FtsA [Pelagibacterales bacterium SAG-MED20]
MKSKNFEVYLDCGLSKIRAGVFSTHNPKDKFYHESNFLNDHSNIEKEIQKIISSLEEKTNEYLKDVTLMIDSPKMISIGVSISKKLDGSRLQKEDVQFLIQDAKQQILRSYFNQSIVHIIIKNYTIDNVKYVFLPDSIDCNLITLDIFFICLPKEIIEYYKFFFTGLDISINQIFCSSYTKSINYNDNFPLIDNVSFIDIGFNKTSINCYVKNEIIFLDVLPIGGNHITKDISNILKVSLKEAENLKLSFVTDQKLLNEKNILPDLIQNIIFARTEEILELSGKSIKLNLNLSQLDQCKLVLMGDGSKILDNKFKEKISFSNDIDLLEETIEDICQSGFKLGRRSNKQEVVVVPKKHLKQGFFEKLFHLFK